MKKFFLIALAFSFVGLTGCNDADDTTVVEDPTIIEEPIETIEPMDPMMADTTGGAMMGDSTGGTMMADSTGAMAGDSAVAPQ